MLSAIIFVQLISLVASQWNGTCGIKSAALDYYTQQPVHFHRCVDDEGNTRNLKFPAGHGHRHRDIQTGDVVDVQGTLLDSGDIEVAELAPRPRPHRGQKVTFQKNVLVVIVRIVKSDGTFVAGTANQTAIGMKVDNVLFGEFSNKDTMAGLWKSCTYGNVAMGNNVDGKANDLPGSNSDIIFVDIPYTCTKGSGDSFCTQSYDSSQCSGNELDGWAQYSLNKYTATHSGFSKSTWNTWVLILPSATSDMGCGDFVGMGSVGCSSSYCYAWIASKYADQLSNYAHELGHGLGFQHSGDVNQASGTSAQEYGDWSCGMGYCCATRCYNAPKAAQMGWLSGITTLQASNFAAGASVQITMNSMTRTNANSAIQITTNWASTTTTYWLQYKLLEGYDKRLGDSSTTRAFANSIGVKKWNGGSSEISYHIISLGVGGVWTDSASGLTVTVVSLSSVDGVAVVIVSRSGGSVVATPTASPAASPAAASRTSASTPSQTSSRTSAVTPSQTSSRTSAVTPSASSSRSASPSRAASSQTASVSRAASPTTSPTRPATAPSATPSATKPASSTCGTLSSNSSCSSNSQCRSCKCQKNKCA